MSKLHKDGLARDLEKMKNEGGLLLDAMGPHWRRWISKPWDGHAYTNLFVEAQRVSPYFMGHIDAVLLPVLVASLAFIVWVLL
ncbi:MAG: hypothetical protein DRQ56_05565 [Gammaproteobacteria bacterium]|nr:MAG: hypothetical protein DRQ56_05565 [Gammaproteobacteria bacterium]